MPKNPAPSESRHEDNQNIIYHRLSVCVLLEKGFILSRDACFVFFSQISVLFKLSCVLILFRTQVVGLVYDLFYTQTEGIQNRQIRFCSMVVLTVASDRDLTVNGCPMAPPHRPGGTHGISGTHGTCLAAGRQERPFPLSQVAGVERSERNSLVRWNPSSNRPVTVKTLIVSPLAKFR